MLEKEIYLSNCQIMTPLQLRDLWLHHLKIYLHIYLMGDRQFNRSKTFWWNEVNWEDTNDEILVLWYN